MVSTNANLPDVAYAFKTTKRPVNFVKLIIRRKGVKRYGKIYGDDKVLSTFVTGFSYRKLCEQSLSELVLIKNQDILNELKMAYPKISLDQIEAARNDLMESLNRSAKNSSIRDTFDPLRFNGKIVNGCKVYSGPRKNDPRAPVPGTIYIQGLCVDHKILEPAKNGPPPRANSSIHTLIKNHIKWKLSIGRYISYALSPDQDFELKINGHSVTLDKLK